MKSLEPLPPIIRPLTDVESSRLREMETRLWDDPSTHCLTCEKQGSFKWLRGQVLEEYECDCVKQWALYRYLKYSGLGVAQQQMSWEELHPDFPLSVENSVLEYAANARANARAGMGMMLYGPSGTGKSMVAVLLLKRLINDGFEGMFIQFNQMLDSHMRSWRNADEERWFIQRVQNTPFLVVDDIGKENRSDRLSGVVDSMFDYVMRSRLNNSLPTIITTNSTPDGLSQAYGSGIMSLLTGAMEKIHVTGVDYREHDYAYRRRLVQLGAVRPLVLR